MRVIGIVTVTNPDYRQDPWRECVAQGLEVCDSMIVVCGRREDIDAILDLQQRHDARLIPLFVEWPQPRWSLHELPKHLNAGLETARTLGADWIIKFDADCFIHENEAKKLRDRLVAELNTDTEVMTVEKIQLIIPQRGAKRHKSPICIKAKSKICYGINKDHYTDLCSPILWDQTSMFSADDKPEHAIPIGVDVPESVTKSTGVHFWNYGYMFKTYDRAVELLYHFNLAHADFWGFGWYKERPADITEQETIENHLRMTAGRLEKHNKTFVIGEHPAHIRQKIKDLTKDQFGHSLWGKIKL